MHWSWSQKISSAKWFPRGRFNTQMEEVHELAFPLTTSNLNPVSLWTQHYSIVVISVLKQKMFPYTQRLLSASSIIISKFNVYGTVPDFILDDVYIWILALLGHLYSMAFLNGRIPMKVTSQITWPHPTIIFSCPQVFNCHEANTRLALPWGEREECHQGNQHLYRFSAAPAICNSTPDQL